MSRPLPAPASAHRRFEAAPTRKRQQQLARRRPIITRRSQAHAPRVPTEPAPRRRRRPLRGSAQRRLRCSHQAQLPSNPATHLLRYGRLCLVQRAHRGMRRCSLGLPLLVRQWQARPGSRLGYCVHLPLLRSLLETPVAVEGLVLHYLPVAHCQQSSACVRISVEPAVNGLWSTRLSLVDVARRWRALGLINTLWTASFGVRKQFLSRVEPATTCSRAAGEHARA